MDITGLQKLVQDWTAKQPENISQIEISLTFTDKKKLIIQPEAKVVEIEEAEPLMLVELLSKKNLAEVGASKNVCTLIIHNFIATLNEGRYLKEGERPTPLEKLDFHSCTVTEFLEVATLDLIKKFLTLDQSA